jgi:Na+-driven multidrug efflux pump
MKDLTDGKEGSLILKFAVPMLLGNVFQQLYNVVDSIIVGNFIGKEALAAVGASFPIKLPTIMLSTILYS